MPEGRYILFEAEQQGWELANACRMGCCTKCAVKVTKRKFRTNPSETGVSEQMRKEGSRSTFASRTLIVRYRMCHAR